MKYRAYLEFFYDSINVSLHACQNLPKNGLSLCIGSMYSIAWCTLHISMTKKKARMPISQACQSSWKMEDILVESSQWLTSLTEKHARGQGEPVLRTWSVSFEAYGWSVANLISVVPNAKNTRTLSTSATAAAADVGHPYNHPRQTVGRLGIQL